MVNIYNNKMIYRNTIFIWKKYMSNLPIWDLLNEHTLSWDKVVTPNSSYDRNRQYLI